ncbi:hypothetical protein PPL_03506 (plasmid) [Heterostelium pallidum]|uniref:Uncharacterized protein n=1 Tax=Heterostelium pallidum (strain ATCC 26659 / Pp 5 / PN500) TaxID=670386 RepID=D3EMR4_HETP5|nr:hypothetical protein PPL_03506 [Heterostelium pallidum]ADC31713.1 hypothetical protein PPL_03506 [Heterostelium pallidum]|eukprot:YP_003422577.1 hypothetical protein PPL_03506 (plasmid) [Heterostelium pallidum]
MDTNTDTDTSLLDGEFSCLSQLEIFIDYSDTYIERMKILRLNVKDLLKFLEKEIQKSPEPTVVVEDNTERIPIYKPSMRWRLQRIEYFIEEYNENYSEQLKSTHDQLKYLLKDIQKIISEK